MLEEEEQQQVGGHPTPYGGCHTLPILPWGHAWLHQRKNPIKGNVQLMGNQGGRRSIDEVDEDDKEGECKDDNETVVESDNDKEEEDSTCW